MRVIILDIKADDLPFIEAEFLVEERIENMNLME
jgi:hypothetical protein